MTTKPSATGPAWAPVAYRRLALRVIQQAFHDLDCSSPELQRSARSFLSGHPPFRLWCDIAHLLPASVTRAANDRDAPARREGRRSPPEGLVGTPQAAAGSPVS
jgi:hypothetical protein